MSPVAERNELPRGQAHGERAKQENFLAATQPAEEQAPVSTSPAPQPIAVQALPDSFEEVDEEPEDDEDGRLSVEVDDPEVGELDLTALLLGDTDRPLEDVRTGLPGHVPQTSLTDTLERVVARSDVVSDDLAALVERARLLGL